jgi:hypothetical protein
MGVRMSPKRLEPPSHSRAEASTGPSVATSVKRIFESKNLTARIVSDASQAIFPGTIAHHLPHDLIRDIESSRFVPKLHQVIALSLVSGYALEDWLKVFGFDLANVRRFQAMLPNLHTIAIDSNCYDPAEVVPWISERDLQAPGEGVTPVGRMVSFDRTQRASSLLELNAAAFTYAKVGREDAFSYPEVLAGSVVRADPRRGMGSLPNASKFDPSLYLVEGPGGYNCCRLKRLKGDIVALGSVEIPCPAVELRLDKDVRVVGRLDVEIRRLFPPEVCTLSDPSPPVARAGPFDSTPRDLPVGQLIKLSRLRAGLTFRAASALTRRIALATADPRYFVAASSLCDYEANIAAAFRIHKVSAICAVYGIEFRRFAHAAGSRADLPLERMRDDLLERSKATDESLELATAGGFLHRFLQVVEEIPLALKDILPYALGRPKLDVRDLFWVGSEKDGGRLLPRGTFLLIVNRLSKTPPPFEWKPGKHQPLFLLVHRNGEFICSSCSSAGGSLVIHDASALDNHPEKSRAAREYEVVGRVVGIVRKLHRTSESS